MLAYMQLRHLYRNSGMLYRAAASRMAVASKAVTLVSSRGCLATMASPSAAVELPHSHAKTFLAERILAAGMVPLFATSLFVHNTYVDYALACAVALHVHWGLHVVIGDYGRPFLLGETLSKFVNSLVYVVSILMFAGLLHFNYTDVGITKAFEMIWSL